MAQLRRDPITREWVNITTERGKRPSDFHHREEARLVPARDYSQCPFCPGNETMSGQDLLRYGTDRSWSLRVVPNKFAAFSGSGQPARIRHGLYESMPAVGAHEVVIETPHHNTSLSRLDVAQVNLVIHSYRERYLALRRDARLKYILIFRNHGKVAGASIKHAHSQIIATPVIPHVARARIEGLQRYDEERHACAYCDMIEQELDAGERLVVQNSAFVALAPYAARHPFETWILPKERNAQFVSIDEAQMSELAAILKETLLRLDLCLGDPPYNFMLLTTDFSDQFHWHIEIIPRLSVAAGFELGTGIYLNTVAPEQAATFLRTVNLPKQAAC